MRRVMLVLVVIGLLAAPGSTAIFVKITADGPIVDGKVQLDNGASTTIRVYGMGTDSGLYSIGGSVQAVPTDPPLLTSVGPMVFTPEFNPSGLFNPIYGTPGLNGGWNEFGTCQTNWGVPDPIIARYDYAEICNYTVTAAPTGSGDVTLFFSAATVGGYKLIEVNKTASFGTFIPVTIHVVPEPVTLALLTLGALAVVRRSRT